MQKQLLDNVEKKRKKDTSRRTTSKHWENHDKSMVMQDTKWVSLRPKNWTTKKEPKNPPRTFQEREREREWDGGLMMNPIISRSPMFDGRGQGGQIGHWLIVGVL